MRVESDLSEAFALPPEQWVGLVTEQSFSHPTRGNAQQVAVLESLHTLLLRSVDDTEHLQQQLEPWRKIRRRRKSREEQPGRKEQI